MSDQRRIKENDEGANSVEKPRRFDLFVSRPLRMANTCMEKLFKDDSFYNSARFAYVDANDAKRLFLYGCARIVLKASIALMQYEEFVKESPDEVIESERTPVIEHTTIEAIFDEQNFWIRKLLELLVNLINFSRDDVPEVYRIYLNAENLDLHIGQFKDLKDFNEFPSGNLQYSVDHFSKRINDDLTTLKTDNVWFLNRENFSKRRPSVFCSVRARFKRALERATNEETVMMGLTYHRHFSMASMSVHPTVGRAVRQFDFETIGNNITFISMLGQLSIDRVNTLAGFEDDKSIAKLMMSNSKAPQFLQRSKKQFEIGDLVLAYNELAEIVETRQSKFGYTGYRVKFLVKAPLPETPEDWVPSEYVFRLLAKAQIRSFVEKMFEDTIAEGTTPITTDIMREVLSHPDERLLESVKGLFVDFHRAGTLIPMVQAQQTKML